MQSGMPVGCELLVWVAGENLLAWYMAWMWESIYEE